MYQNSKMKLALVAYLHGAGGAERQITLLANVMVKRGHEVHFLVLSEFSKRYPIHENVIIHDLTEAEHDKLHQIFGRYKALKKAYKEIVPDITIHYNLQSAYLTLAMPKKVYHKAIYSERGDPYDKEYSGLSGKIRDWTVKGMDGLVFQSEGARDFFNKTIITKSIVIHNSVEVPIDKYPIPKIRCKHIVSAGRLHEQKNFALLIDAFAKIADEFPYYDLYIYGDGGLRDQLQEQVHNCKLNERVSLLSACNDLWNRINVASLFVLSSDYEGMPNALMEAMSLGIPSISTDCRPGGARTLIQDGVNGFVVPRRDVDALADKMRYVLSHPDVAEIISKGGRKVAFTHNEKSTFDKWEKYLEQIKKNDELK